MGSPDIAVLTAATGSSTNTCSVLMRGAVIVDATFGIEAVRFGPAVDRSATLTSAAAQEVDGGLSSCRVDARRGLVAESELVKV